MSSAASLLRGEVDQCVKQFDKWSHGKVAHLNLLPEVHGALLYCITVRPTNMGPTCQNCIQSSCPLLATSMAPQGSPHIKGCGPHKTTQVTNVDINYELYSTEIHLHLLVIFRQFPLVAWVVKLDLLFLPKSANGT